MTRGPATDPSSRDQPRGEEPWATDWSLLDRGWSPRVLDRPVGAWGCVLAWVLATVLFVTWVALIGGPSSGDADQSTVAVLAIARGDYHCAYPSDEHTPTPPLYPMVAAAVVAAAGLAGPTVDAASAPLGPHCATGINIMKEVTKAHLRQVQWVGVLGWLVLLAGFVILLRAIGRGRCGWECAGVLVLACLTPPIECIATIYHPNDLVAMGLLLWGMAYVLTDRWGWAGALVGLACMAHQYALLVAVPLAVLALAERRYRFMGAAAASAAMVTLGAVGLTGAGVLRAIGGEGVEPSGQYTWVARLRLPNDQLVLLTRVLPLVLAALLAVVAVRRLGHAVLTPYLFCSLIALCMGLRLVFELNLFGYRFVTYAVMPVVLDWTARRLRWMTVVWEVGLGVVWQVSGIDLSFWGGKRVWWQVLAVVLYATLVAPAFLRALRRGRATTAPVERSTTPGVAGRA